MSGLVLKDLLVLKKYAKTYLLLFVLFGFISFAGGNSAFMVGIVCMFSAMLPITAMSYDERAHFDKYALSMGVTRTQLVLSKYILCASAVLCGGALVLGFELLMGEIFLESLLVTLCIMAVSMLLAGVLLPIMFKCGVEKGRIYMMVVLLAPTVVIMLLGNFAKQLGGSLQSFANFITSPTGKYSLYIGLPLIFILLLFLSVNTALGVVSKKEY